MEAFFDWHGVAMLVVMLALPAGIEFAVLVAVFFVVGDVLSEIFFEAIVDADQPMLDTEYSRNDRAHTKGNKHFSLLSEFWGCARSGPKNSLFFDVCAQKITGSTK